MNKLQVKKILKVCLIATAIMLASEIVFSIPAINTFFANCVEHSGKWFLFVIWVIMFLQCTILNIPGYVILSASINIGINTLSIEYIAVVLSAYMCGCILAYWLGRWFGKKAVKWCAGSEEDYNKWCTVLNTKGKWWYFLTVIFPLFPDDILCIVAGSVKFNFGFYTIANLIGRGVGLVTMLLTLKLIGSIGGGFPFMIIVWALALIGEFIALIIIDKKIKKSI